MAKALVIGGTGPTGPKVVEGLIRRRFEVTVLHSGKHEIEFPWPVEHIHASTHFPDSLEEALRNRTFDLIIAMYGRLRHVAHAIRGKTPRLIAAGGMPYKVFVEGEKNGRAVPVLIREDAPLWREQSNKFTYQMTVTEETVMDIHRAGDYSATILRFPMIYGPRQVAPREWCIIRRILDGRNRIIIPDGGLKLERRGYVDNVAHAVLLSVDKPTESAGQIYNVGDETVWSLREWIETIASVLGADCELISLPFALARTARPYAGRGFHWVPDIEKIRNGLGYHDQVPADEGMKRTVLAYVENRPPSGGEIEQALGDTFDYEREDALADSFLTHMKDIRDDLPGFGFHHAYDHPKNGEPMGQE
jgi:nucleoside-diphosphate-sugar epimerase